MVLDGPGVVVGVGVTEGRGGVWWDRTRVRVGRIEGWGPGNVYGKGRRRRDLLKKSTTSETGLQKGVS